MDILSETSDNRPEPNMYGMDLDCHECSVLVTEAFYDRKDHTLYWWCEKGHESKIEEVMLDI